MAENVRKKSPRAPSFPLDDALDRVMKVYERERLHPAPTDVVAQHLGYKSANNGAALSALASLRYFGLLERPKEGMLAVSKDVEAYKYAPAEDLRRSLLLGFLRRPALYNELLEKYESGLPSDANLKFELIQRGFIPQAAESVLIVFKQSVDFVDYYRGESMSHDDEGSAAIKIQSMRRAELEPQVSPELEIPPAALSAVVRSPEVDEVESDRIPVRLPGGRRAWLIIPTPFYNADKERLKAQIDLILTSEDEEP